jgi:hypothetical protein
MAIRFSKFLGVFPGSLVKECKYATGFRMSLVASILYFVTSVLAITVPQIGALPDKRSLQQRDSKEEGNACSIDNEELSERIKQGDEYNSRLQSPHVEIASKGAADTRLYVVKENNEENVAEMASVEHFHTEEEILPTIDSTLSQQVESN